MNWRATLNIGLQPLQIDQRDGSIAEAGSMKAADHVATMKTGMGYPQRLNPKAPNDVDN